MRRLWIALSLLFLIIIPLYAQEDGLNLPTELYVLLNDGVVQRYGLGAAGVQQVTADGVFVLDFGIAPDGNWMAYRTPEGLWLVDMFTPGSEMMLEGATADVPPVRGRGDTLAWSPQGEVFAFSTQYGIRLSFTAGAFVDVLVSPPVQHLSWSPQGSYLAVESEGGIWWIYRRNGEEMILVSAIPASVGIAWLNDSQLVFVPPTGGLIQMDLGNINAQTPILDHSWICGLPLVDTDGTILFFARRASDASMAENTGRLIRTTLNGATEDLGTNPLEFNNVRWAKGGSLLLAAEGGALALIEPRSAQGFNLPIPSVAAYTWGPLLPPRVESLILPASGTFLADDANDITQVWTMPRNGARPAPITPAEAPITLYTMSDDGQRVAYVSNGQVWVFAVNGSQPPISLLQIEHEITLLVFSPNGQTLAYVTGISPGDSSGGIWFVPISGGEPEQILVNGDSGGSPYFRRPQFAPNINALLVEVGESEGSQLMVLDLNTREQLPVGQYDGGFWLRDGRIVAYGTGIGIGDPQPSDIFIIDVNTQQPLVPLFTVPADQVIVTLRETANNRLALITAPNRVGPRAMSVFDVPIGGQSTRLGEIRAIVAPQFSPDGSIVVGYTHPRGQLAAYTVFDGELSVLRDPLAVWNFVWGR